MLTTDRSNPRETASVRILPTLPAAALAAFLAAPAPAQEPDLAQGEKLFKRCAACHKLEEGAASSAGPSLHGVIGRPAGGEPDFNYSPAMAEAGANGLVWSEDTLLEYLADPRGMVKGTRMIFPGIKSEEDRRAVIAYIAANGG
jgi:cytochrome c2